MLETILSPPVFLIFTQRWSNIVLRNELFLCNSIAYTYTEKGINVANGEEPANFCKNQWRNQARDSTGAPCRLLD